MEKINLIRARGTDFGTSQNLRENDRKNQRNTNGSLEEDGNGSSGGGPPRNTVTMV